MPKRLGFTSALVSALCAITLAAQGPVHLPLYNGFYVLQDVPCDNPPASAVLHWDGKGFSGDYGNLCITAVRTGPEGGTYEVTTGCDANSQGIRDQVTIPLQLLVLHTTSTFTLHWMGHRADTPRTYRRCPTH